MAQGSAHTNKELSFGPGPQYVGFWEVFLCGEEFDGRVIGGGEGRAKADVGVGGRMAFWGTRVLEIVKKHDSGGLVWKRIKLTTTRKANAKKRLLRVWQVLGFLPVNYHR